MDHSLEDSISLSSFDRSITPEPIVHWGDSLESTARDHMKSIHNSSPVQPTKEKAGDGETVHMLMGTRPAPNHTEQVACAVQQQPTPTLSTNNHLEIVGLPPSFAYQHHVGGDQAFVVRTNIPLYWHQLQSSFAMGNNLNSNYLLGTSHAPLAIAPTFTPTHNMVPGQNVTHGPNVGYNSPAFMHLSHGHYYPTYGHPSCLLPFYPTPATAYNSTSGNPSVFHKSSTRLNEPLHGGVTDISQSTDCCPVVSEQNSTSSTHSS